MNDYYQNTGAGAVRDPVTGKQHRIRVHDQVPYITVTRKTRVLFQGPMGLGAFVNIDGEKVYFRDVIQQVQHNG